ncbi:hypothetical protein AZE42_12189, partial [Rhizopogon vesiculosus]
MDDLPIIHDDHRRWLYTERSGGYLTNQSINGLIAQQQNGATIVIEHRFFGYSNPSDLTSQSLALLTIQQAIDDLVYFATNADLPMPGGDAVKPGQAPWILIGGSYSGALTSWMMVNCSSDVQAVIAYLDGVYAVNDTAGIQTLKEVFGLVMINLVDRQSLQPDIGLGAMFLKFCDALEVKDGINAGPGGWGLENAIYSWGNFWNTTYYNYRKVVCGGQDAESCIGTYDTSESYGTNTIVNNAVRCNQVGLYQDGLPYGQPAIVSRILDTIYHDPTTAETNMTYAGWNVDVERFFFANGLRDPWRESNVSADGLYKPSTPSMPIYEG